MHIQEIMSKPAVTCRTSDMLNTAAQLMWEHDCGAIPVVRDDGSLVGMITDRDISMAAYTRGEPLAAIPVSHAMANEVYACREGDSLEMVERVMGDKQIRRVPIVDGSNRPVGVVSLNDIARYAAVARKRDGLDQELAKTLAAICQPHSRREPTAPRSRPQQQLRARA